MAPFEVSFWLIAALSSLYCHGIDKLERVLELKTPGSAGIEMNEEDQGTEMFLIQILLSACNLLVVLQWNTGLVRLS